VAQRHPWPVPRWALRRGRASDRATGVCPQFPSLFAVSNQTPTLIYAICIPIWQCNLQKLTSSHKPYKL
jgi:hypothetical protein